MKTKLIIMFTVVALSLCLLACSPAPKPVPISGDVSISCDDFMKLQHISQEVQVATGDSFTVTLCSNPTTGFEWEAARISDQTVLQQVAHKFLSPEDLGDRPPPPGSPGQEVWTFTALKEGKSTISIDYSRPWEGDEKGEWTFVLTVVVK